MPIIAMFILTDPACQPRHFLPDILTGELTTKVLIDRATRPPDRARAREEALDGGSKSPVFRGFPEGRQKLAQSLV